MSSTEEDITCASDSVFPQDGRPRLVGISGFGYQEFASSLPKLSFEVEAYWDTSINPFGESIFLYPSTIVSLQLFLDKADEDSAWIIPKALLTRVDMTTPVRGAVSYSLAGTLAPHSQPVRAPYSEFEYTS